MRLCPTTAKFGGNGTLGITGGSLSAVIPNTRMVNAGIKTWLPAPLQSDVEPKE